jgi:hypothetical protein
MNRCVFLLFSAETNYEAHCRELAHIVANRQHVNIWCRSSHRVVISRAWVFFYGRPSGERELVFKSVSDVFFFFFFFFFFWHFRVYFVWLATWLVSTLTNINWKGKTKIAVIIYVWLLNGKMYFTFPDSGFVFKGHQWWLWIRFVFDWLNVWPKILSILNYIQSTYFISSISKFVYL